MLRGLSTHTRYTRTLRQSRPGSTKRTLPSSSSSHPATKTRTIMFRGYGQQSEEVRWAKLSTTMEYFHDHFKEQFTRIYELADGSFTKQGMSLPMFLREADSLKKHLEAHHSIEETYIFPMLAVKMPSFSHGEQHKKSHEGIHDGLVRLGALTHSFRAEPTSYSPEKLRECLDSFKEVLMRHLDEEVADLQPENLKRYWTLEELERIPI